ncbi:hypothetical protein EDC04DRAFT_2611524 [Pisolithus marmoratus]|nr:hypothetical protein EDC04DRAFT_2611524 [Pisolithus marmoratus]
MSPCRGFCADLPPEVGGSLQAHHINAVQVQGDRSTYDTLNTNTERLVGLGFSGQKGSQLQHGVEKEMDHTIILPSSASPVNVEADLCISHNWIQGWVNQGGDQQPSAGIQRATRSYERPRMSLEPEQIVLLMSMA